MQVTRFGVTVIKDMAAKKGPGMITLGIICLIIGFVFHLAFLWAIGILLLVIGLILALLGMAGREIAGRRHFY